MRNKIVILINLKYNVTNVFKISLNCVKFVLYLSLLKQVIYYIYLEWMKLTSSRFLICIIKLI